MVNYRLINFFHGRATLWMENLEQGQYTQTYAALWRPKGHDQSWRAKATHGGSREVFPWRSRTFHLGDGPSGQGWPREMSRKMKPVGWWMARARQQRRWASSFPPSGHSSKTQPDWWEKKIDPFLVTSGANSDSNQRYCIPLDLTHQWWTQRYHIPFKSTVHSRMQESISPPHATTQMTWKKVQFLCNWSFGGSPISLNLHKIHDCILHGWIDPNHIYTHPRFNHATITSPSLRRWNSGAIKIIMAPVPWIQVPGTSHAGCT